MRSERGSGGGVVGMLMVIWALWMITIMFVILTDNQYGSEQHCLDEWSKCDLVSETWEPSTNAEEK